VKLLTEVEGDRFTTSVSHHTACFSLPKKFCSGAEQTTAAGFVEDIVEDRTGGEILPAQAERIAAEIDEASNNKGKKRASNSGASGTAGTGAASGKNSGKGKDDASSPLAEWKQAYEANGGGPKEPPAKKKKGGSSKNDVIDLLDDDETKPASSSKAKSDSDDTTNDAAAHWYGHYVKTKNEALKDILRWNRQVQTPPTKDALLYKVIDGHLHGRLARCVLCGGGRLKLVFNSTTVNSNAHCVSVICGGSFDEDTQRRIECAYTCTPESAPRLQPWYYENEPTEAEKEEMDRIDEEAKAGGVGGNGSLAKSSGASKVKGEDGVEEVDDMDLLQQAAAALTWNLASREGLKKAAADILSLLQDHAGPRTVDLPMEEDTTSDNNGQRVAITVLPKIGQTIAANRTKTAAELMPLIVEQFGFKQDKQRKADRKQAALATIVTCPDNAALVAAFVELSDLYYKTGNTNAGGAYKKVVAALAALPEAVTEANALGLGKGKTKVANIGKSSAEKIHEFVTTGTLQKLEEKRADAS
jgi:Helix-hairpin-helix domain